MHVAVYLAVGCAIYALIGAFYVAANRTDALRLSRLMPSAPGGETDGDKARVVMLIFCMYWPLLLVVPWRERLK